MLTINSFKNSMLLTASSFMITFLLFVFNFIFQVVKPVYFICNNLVSYKLFNLAVNYPSSCDQESYYSAIQNLTTIFNDGYVYQGRALYILINSSWLNLLDLFSNSQLEVLTHISVTITHTTLLIISTLIIMWIFKVRVFENIKIYILIYSLLLMSPLYKWGVFDPSNQTFTLLIILLNLYIYLNHQSFINYKTSLLIGTLVLIHRVFIVGYLLVFVLLFLEKQYSFTFNNIKKSIKYLLISVLPFVIYNIYILIFQGQMPYDENSSYYGQFIWLPLYLFTDKRYEGGWHCMEPMTFLKCYGVDNLNLFFYLFLPLIFYLFNLFRDKSENKTFVFSLLKYTSLVYVFYSFIGWYPPIRFSYYSLGHLIILGNIYYLINEENKVSKIFHFISISLYFLFLNHWNHPDIVEFNFGLLTSCSFLILYFITKTYNKEGLKIE